MTSEPPVLTREQVRRLDRLAVEQYGLPGVVLMENAGRAVADVVAEAAAPGASVAIFCGGGNNGGDGYVAARHLANAQRHVTIYATKDPQQLQGDAAIHAHVAERMGVDVQVIATQQHLADAVAGWCNTTVIVDALLGTGFAGPVRPPTAWLIDACNRMRDMTVVAVDVPSGLDCDTGQPAEPTVRADVTVTFVARKPGFNKPAATDCLGRVIVADIGVPRGLILEVSGD